MAAVYYPPNILELGFPQEILELFNAFPFGMRKRMYKTALFDPFLPPSERALTLTEYYYQRYSWMYVYSLRWFSLPDLNICKIQVQRDH